MSKGVPLTTENIVPLLKKAGFVTNESLDKRLTGFATRDDLTNGLNNLRKQINDDQFEARAEFYQKMTKPEIDRIAIKIDKLDIKLSSEISGLKDDLTGLNAEFSTHHHTPILKN